MANTVDYDEKYIEACFYAWYSSPDRSRTKSAGGNSIVKHIPPTSGGRKPDIQTVRRWMDSYAWEQRADALDAAASERMDKEVVEKRVATLRELAQNGEELKNKALEYIRNTTNPFDENPSAAVRALVAGTEMQFKYAGMADMLANVAQMTDKQIEREIYRLLGKNEDTNVVDAESEDIPSDNDDSTEDNEP